MLPVLVFLSLSFSEEPGAAAPSGEGVSSSRRPRMAEAWLILRPASKEREDMILTADGEMRPSLPLLLLLLLASPPPPLELWLLAVFIRAELSRSVSLALTLILLLMLNIRLLLLTSVMDMLFMLLLVRFTELLRLLAALPARYPICWTGPG